MAAQSEIRQEPLLRRIPPTVRRAFSEKIMLRVLVTAVGSVAIWGWAGREQSGLDPERGTGYALGIVGAAMMTALLIYPMRKRFMAMRWLGSVALWFRLHILLGLIGPLVILFHARFSYSATNSGVALMSMLVVVAAGLIAWIPYRHVYGGYSLRKIELRDLLDAMAASRAELEHDGNAGEEVQRRLEAMERRATLESPDLLHGLLSLFTLNVAARWMRFRLKREIRRQFADHEKNPRWSESERRQHQRDASRHLAAYLHAVRETAGFAIYGRLFGFWHFLHLPLYIFLIVTVIIHVTAVHMY